MTTPYVIPQVLVFQEYNQVPAAITQALQAHISGPHAYLLRYAQPTEKPIGALGAYDPANDHFYLWPQLPAGGIVDQPYTALFIDGATLEYFDDLIGELDVVAPVSGKPNRIRIADATYGFKYNGVGFPRFPALYDRDVQVGDTVSIRGIVGGTPYSLMTYVQSIAADQTTATISPVTADPSNGNTQSATNVVTQVAGVENCNTLVANLGAYNAYGDGVLDDTYTVTVTDSSVDGEIQTAVLRITSASGLDDTLVVSPAEIDTYFTVGHRGLALKFDCTGHSLSSLSVADLIVGQSWTVAIHNFYVHVNAVSAGTYIGPVNATYIVEVTRGGLFAAATNAKPQITITTDVSSDRSGPTTIAALSTAYPVGAYGVTISFSGSSAIGLNKGDRFFITVAAAKNGRYSTLVLGNNLPVMLQSATDLDLRLSLTKNIQVPQDRIGFEPATNWDQAALELSIYSGMIAYDPSFTNNGIPVAVPVTGGQLFIQYRAWQQTLVKAVGTINDVANLDTQISGALTPDNPLKWGVYYALLNANGANVLYTSVSDPTNTATWIDVLATITGNTNVYNLVPLTHDQTVLNLYQAQVDAQSTAENGCWSAMFTSLQTITQKPIVSPASSTDSGVVLATLVANPDIEETAYTLLTVPAGNAQFVVNNVQPSDIVRFFYSSSWGEDTWQAFTVNSVTSEDALLLVAGPDAPVEIASRVEIWHPLSKDEQATYIGRAAGAYADNRVCATWPDQIGSGGTIMDGFYVGCALAGLRSGVVPQQGLTNVQVAGFDDVSRTTVYFNASQLNTMAGDGVWIVTQNTAGVVSSRQAITTDTSDVLHSHEMVRANLDSISYFFLDYLAPYIGVSNVTPTLIATLYTQLNSAIQYLLANGFTTSLGGQIIDATIVELRPHAILADRIVGVLSVDLPVDLDNIELHLVV